MMLPSSKLAALVTEAINRLIPPALTRQSVVMADNIDDVVCNETIAGVILKNAHDLKETIEKTTEQRCSRSFNAIDMLNITRCLTFFVLKATTM